MPAYAFRTRTRLFGAATATLAALSLTACQDDGQGTRDEGAANPKPSQSAGAKPGGSAQNSVPPAKPTQSNGSAGTSTGGSSSTGGNTTDSTGDSAPGASEDRAPCTGANTTTTTVPVERPLNHMLITVTNTGSTACDLYHYPAVQFGDSQSVPPVIEETRPQAVTTLAPGTSGYAGVTLSAADGSGSHGYTAKTLTVHFYDADNNSIGPAAKPALPAKGVYVDASVRVTYWLSDAQAALH